MQLTKFVEFDDPTYLSWIVLLLHAVPSETKHAYYIDINITDVGRMNPEAAFLD